MSIPEFLGGAIGQHGNTGWVSNVAAVHCAPVAAANARTCFLASGNQHRGTSS
jgi:hypothetical protein